MALEYELTLAGTTPVEQVAQRALPDPAERPTGTPPLLSADLYEKYGFGLTVRAGKHAYIDVDSDGESWLWEPKTYVSLTFRMDKFADFSWNVINMLTVARRVLETGPEDAVLVLNGDILLFGRLDGTAVKHSRDGWWTSYPGANEVLVG